MTFKMSHAGSVVSGQWAWSWVSTGSGNPGSARGTFLGTVSEDGSVALMLQNVSRDCSYLYAAQIRRDNQVSGPYVSNAATCSLSVQGTISLSRN